MRFLIMMRKPFPVFFALRVIFPLIFHSGFLAAQGTTGATVRSGSFTSATRCSVDPSGYVYVLDAGTNELLKNTTAGKVVCSIGGYGWTTLTFDQPADLSSPNGLDVYVADYGNHRIQRFDRNLNFISSLYLRDDENPGLRFGYPRGVDMDRFGALYLVDGENIRILKFDATNAFERSFGGEEAGNGRLHSPSRLRVSVDDQVYVQDGNSLVVFNVFGNFVRTIGDGLFRNLQTFTVNESALYALDSCTVRVLNNKGEVIWSYDLLREGLVSPCEVKDFAVLGKQLYILTSKEIIVRNLPEKIPGN
jgi:DNA-binding beta-propeller fold protein YncE